jgi:hypothetical protein
MLLAAAIAWNNRKALVERGLAYAILLHNEGEWREWPLEEFDFEEWFYSELNDFEDALT